MSHSFKIYFLKKTIFIALFSIFWSFVKKSETHILLKMNSLNYQASTGSESSKALLKGIVCSNFRPERLVLRFRRPFMPRN